MITRLLLIAAILLPAISQAKQLSQTFKVSHHQFSIIKSYDSFSKRGTISLKTCQSCPEKSYSLSNKTVLADNGIVRPIEDLLEVTLSNPAKHILVQTHKFDASVFYIEWGYPQGEEEGLE
jgi:hypothetical protein